MVRKALRRHQSHRFFTRCHVAVSRLSYTAFLRPFRMTVGRKGVIMRKTSGVIRSEREGSAAVVRKAVRCHPGNRILHSVSLSHLPPFLQGILVPIQNDEGRQGVILNECEGSIPVMRKVVRCHQSHRFFTRCHVAVSRFSYKEFLHPFRMTIGGRG